MTHYCIPRCVSCMSCCYLSCYCAHYCILCYVSCMSCCCLSCYGVPLLYTLLCVLYVLLLFVLLWCPTIVYSVMCLVCPAAVCPVIVPIGVNSVVVCSMYVTCTVIRYYILHNTHAKSEKEKSRYLIQQHCIDLCDLRLVSCPPKFTTMFINTLFIMYWVVARDIFGFPGSLKKYIYIYIYKSPIHLHLQHCLVHLAL